jgi:DNA excision repair protein ERCC-8
MNPSLLARSTGELSPRAFATGVTAEILRSFAPHPHHRFDGESTNDDSNTGKDSEQPSSIWAHRVGVNALALDKFNGRFLISGGADGSVKVWDLESIENPNETRTFRPIAKASRTLDREDRTGHTHGITHLDFYPFDSDAFLSSAFDKSLKLWSTERASVSASFDLNANIYSHATSPIADHLLVACASQHSAVRLVDLRSGSSIQALVAHGGAVLSVAWSPRYEHILASGHVDGKVRIWDVRRAGGVIGHLDQEDGLGIAHRFEHVVATGGDWAKTPHFRVSARAHNEGVNSLTWTDDGKYIVSAGLDRRIRVWDAATGANTLVSFGSVIQNQQPKTVGMFVSPVGLTAGHRILFWPNETEILALDLNDGTIITRLRMPGAANSTASQGTGGMNVRNRITSIAWRGSGGHGRQIGAAMGGGDTVGGIYSAHLDGQIRAWIPHLSGPEEDDIEDQENEDEDVKRRKRKAVDDAFKSLMGRHVTFT